MMSGLPIRVIYPLEMMLYQSPLGEAFLEAFLHTWGSFEPETLIRVLNQGAAEDQLFSLFVLGFHSQTTEQLLPFLTSQKSMERWASAISLGRMQDEQALAVLLEMLTEFLPPHEQYRSNGTFEWRYDMWRSHIPSLLIPWKSPRLVPYLRRALQKVLDIVQHEHPMMYKSFHKGPIMPSLVSGTAIRMKLCMHWDDSERSERSSDLKVHTPFSVGGSFIL